MGKIAEFLELYSKKTTKSSYRTGVLHFLDFVYGKQRKGSRVRSERELEKYEKLAERYLKEVKNERDVFNDLLRFAASLSDKPPLTARTYFAGVKEFLASYDIELTTQQVKRIRNKLPKGKSRTVEADLDHEKLRKILQHMDLKGKVLVLTLLSSGMRIGEALQIELDDVNLSTEPAEIIVRGEYTKNGVQRFTFVSKEARDALLEWLRVRNKYLRAAKNRNKGLRKKGIGSDKDADDRRIFPFSVDVAERMWKRALKKAGLLNKDRKTGRSDLRIHQLRKFFRSQLALKCPVEIVESLMGHEGYLTECYRRYTKKQMAEYYLKGEYLLLVQVPKEIAEVEREVKGEVEGIRKLVVSLSAENKELQKQNDVLRKKIDELVEKYEKRVDEIDSKIEQEVEKLAVQLKETVKLLLAVADGVLAPQQLKEEFEKLGVEFEK